MKKIIISVIIATLIFGQTHAIKKVTPTKAEPL
jgi:hypothetical protein